MKFGKKPTTWVSFQPSMPQPRNFIEYAMQQLYELAVPEEFYTENYGIKHYGQLKRFKKSDIVGGEWWIQSRSGKEGIGFHYDKVSK